MKRTFVLGGFDTEMKEIAQLLDLHGERYIFAKEGDSRVSRTGAYDATSPKPAYGQVWIECCHKDYSKKELVSLGIEVIDHHSEGDYGYGMPASKYFEASSIGQVHNLLGWEPSLKTKIIAAADHCLMLAYMGTCPGVKRADLLSYRLEFYAKKYKDPMKWLQEAHEEVKKCPNLDIMGTNVKDISTIPKRYKPFLSEVGCYYNVKTINFSHKEDGSTKVFLSNLSKEDLGRFMDTTCYKWGTVKKVYGDPTRQFVGCIYSDYHGLNS